MLPRASPRANHGNCQRMGGHSSRLETTDIRWLATMKFDHSMEQAGAAQDRMSAAFVSDVASLVQGVAEQGLDEYIAHAKAYMPGAPAEQELVDSVNRLQDSFSRQLQESFVRFGNLAQAVLASPTALAPGEQTDSHADRLPVHLPDGTMCNKLRREVENAWGKVLDMADKEKELMACLTGLQPQLFVDASSLDIFRTIFAESQELQLCLQSCSDEMAQHKGQESQLAIRKQADSLVAESGGLQVQQALMLCMGQQATYEP
eukprot:jgi/Ulvmu1/7554/UM037_0098.1